MRSLLQLSWGIKAFLGTRRLEVSYRAGESRVRPLPVPGAGNERVSCERGDGPYGRLILRGVTLRGIDSVMASQARRQRAWDALADTLNRDHLRDIYRVVPMTGVPELAPKIVAGEVRGRLVVDVNA